MPSVLVIAKDPQGSDTVDVRLVVDGRRVADRLPATAVEMDPGEHALRLEHAGWPSVERRVVVREGEKDRHVALRFAAAREAGVAHERGSPTLGIVMLGVGIVAAGIAVTFGVLGKSRENELASAPCGQDGTCAHDEVNVVRRDYWTAGIAGGVAALALGIGIWQLLTPRVTF